MSKPAFARLRFGDWSSILVGQINRGHYGLAIGGNGQVRGFVGWALASRERAEAWVEGLRSLSYDESTAGECMVINAWAANDTAVQRFLVDEVRNVIKDKETLYFKRFYNDGRVRPVRLNVNQFVAGHVARKQMMIALGSEP